jgi:DNA-binding IclR family transcriptional regulator
MSKLKTAWECGCGAIAYGKLPPEECKRCNEEGSYVEADEDHIESLADENLMEQIRARDWGEEE